MSEVGLNSNIYDISNKYLEILNHFLVEANYHPTTVTLQSTEEVQSFLRQLSDPLNTNFQIQMVTQIIHVYLKKHLRNQAPEVFLQHLMSFFEHQKGADPESLQKLELLAEALNEECDHAYSRIRFSR